MVKKWSLVWLTCEGAAAAAGTPCVGGAGDWVLTGVGCSGTWPAAWGSSAGWSWLLKGSGVWKTWERKEISSFHVNGYNKTSDMLRFSLSSKSKKLTVVLFKKLKKNKLKQSKREKMSLIQLYVEENMKHIFQYNQ